MATPTATVWAVPQLSDLYQDVISGIGFRLDNLSKGLDVGLASGTPTGAIRWSSTDTKWQKWSGTAWGDLATTYSINVSGAGKLTTARTIALTGDVTYTSGSFDGTANVTGTATLKTSFGGTEGPYGGTTVGTSTGQPLHIPVLTINAKGLITAATQYNLGTMATQAASGVDITGGTVKGITILNVPSGSGSTTEGYMQWDVTNDLLTVGTGAATKTFVDTNSTQTLSGKTFTTQSQGNNSTAPATTAYVDSGLGNKANTASPSLTGTPVSTTPSLFDNSFKIATTEYVQKNTIPIKDNIAAGTDLNTLTSTGIYHQPTTANATIVLNYPVAEAGRLEVYTVGVYTYQYYHKFNSTLIYVRAKYDVNNFTSWSRLALSSEIISTTKTNSIATATAIAPDSNAVDLQVVHALTTDLTVNAPTGTPLDGQKLMFRLKDNGAAVRNLTFTQTGTNCYRIAGVIIPATTTLGKVLHIGCIYNAIGSGTAAVPVPTWDVIAVAQQL